MLRPLASVCLNSGVIVVFCFLSAAKGLSMDKDINNHDKNEGWKLASMPPLSPREDTVKRVSVAHGDSLSPGDDSVPFVSRMPSGDMKGRRRPEDVVVPGYPVENIPLENSLEDGEGVHDEDRDYLTDDHQALKDHQVDLEESHGDEPTAASGTHWVNAVAASLVVSACSLVGILFGSSRAIASAINISHACLVASGALLATAFLHILPEGMEGLESEHPGDLHAQAHRGGFAVLLGVLFGVIVHAALSSGHEHKHDMGYGMIESPKSEVPVTTLQGMIHRGKDRKLLDLKGLDPICWNVIMGDLLHNFADGVLIGTSFLSCSSVLGWTVTASTVMHEIPHEMADFMALLHGGMSLFQAYLYNFLSALSAVAGVAMILALGGEMTPGDVAFMLLVGGGSFMFLALAELLPEALVDEKGGAPSPGRKLRKVVSFGAGVLLIGVPLLWDRHCEGSQDQP